MRPARPALALAVVALGWPAAAGAHANLVRSEPADGAVVARAPTEVRLVFDDAIRPLGDAEAVRNGGGSVLAGKERRTGPRVLVVPVRRRLRNGDYSVRWRALSDDGHVIAGVVAFGVGAGRASPTSVLSAGSTDPSARSVISRWLFLFGLLAAFGAAVFELFVWRRGDSTRLAMLMLAGFVAAFLGASGLIPHEGGATRFGVLYEIGAVIALVGGAAAALTLADPRARLVPPLAALALLPVPSLAGHALDTGHPRPLNAAVDVVHTASAAVWVGGLLALALVFRRDLAQRFSALALGSVVVLGATGVTRAVFELSAVSQLWSTGYGRALLVKTGLLGALVTLGWLNRYRLIPRGGGGLRLSVRAETVLVAGLVVAVAFLTALPPGRRAEGGTPRASSSAHTTLPTPLPGAVVMAAEDGKLAVAVAVQGRTIQAIVVDPQRRGLSGLRVSFWLPGGAVRARPCGAGCYEARVPTTPRRVEVRHAGGGYPTSAATFFFPATRRPAGTLVRRATAFFRHARTVVFDERLSSGPGNRVETRWQLAAPNRFSYSIRRGPQGVVIGSRRWDKVAGGPWVPSPQTPLPQPTPTWGSKTTNAYVLASRRRSVVVSFFDPRLYAWFQLTLDRSTARPSTMSMTAAAHFMRQNYLSYNRPVAIRPP